MRRRSAALAVVCLFTGACSAGPGADPAPAGWTVLVYSMADTDLEPFLLADLAEIGEVSPTGDLAVTVLADRATGYTDEPALGLGDWEGGKVLQFTAEGVEVVEELGLVNTGDPDVLRRFVADGLAAHPAEHTAVILTDHGAAWSGVGGDESAGADLLTLGEMQDAVAGGLADAGVDRLDLLGFDACLMATYETASTFAGVADRMLASQELEPGHGWDYRVLQMLADDPATTVDDLGRAVLDGFDAQAREEGTEADITLSLVDLTRMAAVDDAMDAFSGALTERVVALAPVVGAERATTLGFGRSPDPVEDTHMADLGILASQIGVEALDVSDEADALVRAINDAVVDRVEGQATRGATGLSIYFPPQAEYFDVGYAEVPGAGSWAGFLSGFYAAGEDVPAGQQPRFLDEGSAVVDGDGLTLVGTLDPATAGAVSEAVISFGVVGEDGGVTFLGEEPATVADDGSGQALGVYDLTTLTISDGEDTAQAYLTLTAGADGVSTIDVPMAYYAPGDLEGGTYQDVLLALTVDAAGDVVNETYYAYDEELGTYGELTADPAGIVVPEVLAVGPDGEQTWTPTTDVGLYADLPALQYELTPVPSGSTLYAELTVTDFAGNTDTVSATVDVP
jgi:hypothetical protein